MAGAGMTDIKSRIKSVSGTMQITKAMELVATSKLRRAKINAERTRPFTKVLKEAVQTVISSPDITLPSPAPAAKKTLIIVIGGDRGLAGGYNAAVFRLADSVCEKNEAIYLPIGKKAFEYYSHRQRELLITEPCYVSDLSVSDSYDFANSIVSGYLNGEFCSAKIVYTRFVSMLTQTPVLDTLLPFDIQEEAKRCEDVMIGGDPEEILKDIIPSYIGGIIYSALCEASAAESAARRTAMNAANKNASEMIDDLMLKYNRARQAIITQEITEIVSGAEAL